MALNILGNRKNTSVVLHVSGGNETITIAGNTSTSTIATSDEIITGAYIAQVIWGNGTDGVITLTRGGTLVATYDTTGHIDYAGVGMPLTLKSTDNLTVNLSGNSYIIIELQKQGTFTSEYLVN